MANPDIVVIGASAGGIPPIQRVISALPADFPAAVFITIHTAAESPRFLSHVLGRTSHLPVDYPEDGESVKKRRIYLAPPDRHMLLEKDTIRVTAGPRENRHRPAVDTLFRSAARSYGQRVVAILLSGSLDDGTAGLSVVTRHGGVTIVQDPDEARFASMPENALKNDSPRYVLPARKIAAKLLELMANGQRPRARAGHPDSKLNKEVKIAEIDMAAIEREKPGAPSVYSCPGCNGTLWEIREGKVLRFRCRVGHAYGAENLLAAKNEELESALWTALRTLEEKAALHQRLSGDASRRQNSRVARHFRQTAEDMHKQAQTIRHVLVEREQPLLTGSGD